MQNRLLSPRAVRTIRYMLSTLYAAGLGLTLVHGDWGGVLLFSVLGLSLLWPWWLRRQAKHGNGGV